MYLVLLNYILKNGKDGKFYVCVSYQEQNFFRNNCNNSSGPVFLSFSHQVMRSIWNIGKSGCMECERRDAMCLSTMES